ncbi:MAG: hypothetical protein JRG76_01505 [Deltaproteobacteria bacterium]|nr:hypothetical protein [Deltaproteobacteria bacterium]
MIARLLLVLLLTPAGAALPVAEVGAATLELAEKARLFRAALHERHVSREGLVIYKIHLPTWEDDLARGTYPRLADTPFFNGSWAATSCTRARVEPAGPERAAAMADARRALDGLRFLMDVTGVQGLMARGVRRDEGLVMPPQDRPWLPGAPGFERYVYRADVSADQYASGLVPAIAECADLFPERTRRLAVDFASHLVRNDMRLVDARGVQTRFGDLSYRSGAGFNSIFQLTGWAAFVLAAELDPDPRWAHQRDRLRDRLRVPARSRRTNLRILGVTNYSNDLMSWNLYRALVPIARRNGDPALAELRHGLHRARLRGRGEPNAYFAALLCRIEPESCDRAALAAGRAVLEDFPIDKRAVIPSPERLAALPRRWIPGRKWRAQASVIVPIADRPRSSFEWKSNPYRLDGRDDPERGYTGLDYLAAYWLYRSIPGALEPPGEPRPTE